MLGLQAGLFYFIFFQMMYLNGRNTDGHRDSRGELLPAGSFLRCSQLLLAAGLSRSCSLQLEFYPGLPCDWREPDGVNRACGPAPSASVGSVGQTQEMSTKATLDRMWGMEVLTDVLFARLNAHPSKTLAPI